jgi:hypothetical protein
MHGQGTLLSMHKEVIALLLTVATGWQQSPHPEADEFARVRALSRAAVEIHRAGGITPANQEIIGKCLWRAGSGIGETENPSIESTVDLLLLARAGVDGHVKNSWFDWEGNHLRRPSMWDAIDSVTLLLLKQESLAMDFASRSKVFSARLDHWIKERLAGSFEVRNGFLYAPIGETTLSASFPIEELFTAEFRDAHPDLFEG